MIIILNKTKYHRAIDAGVTLIWSWSSIGRRGIYTCVWSQKLSYVLGVWSSPTTFVVTWIVHAHKVIT